MFIQITGIGIDDKDYADSNSYGHMMIQLSDDEDYTSLFSGSGSGSGQITFGNKSSNVSSNPVTNTFEHVHDQFWWSMHAILQTLIWWRIDDMN